MQKRKLERLTIRPIAIVAAGIACSSSTASVEPLPAGGHHVLFIGNSLTYVNDLPWTVAAIAASAGDTIRYRTAAGPNLALIDHLNGATNAVAEIKAGGWEYVVLALPGYLKRFTVAYYLQALVPHAMPQDSTVSALQSFFKDATSPVGSVLALGLILVAFLSLAARAVGRREYVLEQ